MDALEPFQRTYTHSEKASVVWAPGRVNLIGDHIDYHGLPVLPIATERRIEVAFTPRTDRRIRAVSSGKYGTREFDWTDDLVPVAAGDWENYLRAAARTVGLRWGLGCGIDAAVVSDLPVAAGLSSSSALYIAFTLCLLRANGHHATFEELMEVLPGGEQFVGTRGGGMDHAASLGSKEGCASWIHFEPLSVRHIPVPEGWAFLVAHSLQTAEKSGSAREQYNARRAAGSTALGRLGFASYHEALEGRSYEDLANLASKRLDTLEERDGFLHVASESLRVTEAVKAMETHDEVRLGRLLVESHVSLRDRLKVSCLGLDRLVEAAMESNALGARLTGGGFGGCAVVFCRRADLPAVRRGIVERYYSKLAEFEESRHLIDSHAGPGALHWEAATTA